MIHNRDVMRWYYQARSVQGLLPNLTKSDAQNSLLPALLRLLLHAPVVDSGIRSPSPPIEDDRSERSVLGSAA